MPASPSGSILDAIDDIRVLQPVFDTAVDGIVAMDEHGTIELINRAAERVFGYAEGDLLGRNVMVLMPEAEAFGHGRYVTEYLKTGRKRIIDTARDVFGRRKDGATFPLHLSVGELMIRDGRHFIGVCQDASERVAMLSTLTRMAQTDALTGALNRRGVAERSEHLLASCRVQGLGLAVLFIDLDDFKEVNAHYGHRVGDELLMCSVDRIAAAVRPDDVVARVGGDEFVVLMAVSADGPDAAAAANDVVVALGRPFALSVGEVSMCASVGISLFPDHGETAGDLINQAEQAMAEAKRLEVRTMPVRVFDRELRERTRREFRLVEGIRRAISCEELVLHYQPQFDLETLQPVGLEALVRWQHPTEGLLMPGAFLDVALEHGLMPHIGRWVVRRACRDNARLIERGVLDVPVAVNIDAAFFAEPGFVPHIRTALADVGLAAERLEVEVVESLALSATQQVGQNVRELAELGICLAMDDFGTGYSSLRQLQEQKFGRLKIDQSFVARAWEKADDAAIVTAILDLAQALGIEAIAEGIETDEQRGFLRGRGCRFGQGYWYARPMPFDALTDWLTKRERSS